MYTFMQYIWKTKIEDKILIFQALDYINFLKFGYIFPSYNTAKCEV